MSQSAARRRRRECKRAGRHLALKTDGQQRFCAHCGVLEQVQPAGTRGILTPKVTREK